MPRKTPELIAARRKEIIDACEHLYLSKGFAEITLADISKETTFTRTSIYNYFHTKEEIFLALLQREYDSWADEIDKAADGSESLSDSDIADLLAHSLERRRLMLRLLSMNFYDMEAGSRFEKLTEFKVSYGRTLSSVGRFVSKFRPDLSEEEVTGFLYSFFPYLYGLCPYTEVTDRQGEAMAAAGIGFVPHSVYDLTYGLVMKLLTVNNRR